MSQEALSQATFWPQRRYDQVYSRSLQDPEGFWAEEARRLEWFRTWDRVLDWNPPFARWFPGGQLNASYLCADRHAQNERKNKVAIYWEGEPGDTRAISYADLYREVNRVAAVLQKLGLRTGDRVAIYLPMIPELPIFMLACARLGAPFTVVFSGFSGQALADRMNDIGSTLLVTADGGYRRGKIVNLKHVADQALGLAPSVKRCIVVRRTGAPVPMQEGRDVWLHDVLPPGAPYVQPVPLDSSHPLYVLYTSGTTGKPKGIVHGTGGYMVFTHSTFRWVFNTRDDSVYWCAADVGWVTGHSYIVFAPLSHGATTVLYEGAPDYPAPDRWWSMIEKYGVTVFYTSPTAIRMFMALGEELPRRHDLRSLELLGSVGEPINPAAWLWYYRNIGGERCPIVDTWWQTETGGIMMSPAPGIALAPLKPGSVTFPLPGVDSVVVNEKGEPQEPGERGFLVIRKPWPGMLMTLRGDDEKYREVYWSRFPGVYYTGDYAIRDQDGYYWLLGRADEVLKVAGHRLGTLELENAVVSHPAVAEAAAVGRPDPIKGETAVIFAILRKGNQATPELEKVVKDHVRKTVGPVAVPDSVYFVSKLPKTRSGKIMRRVLRAVAAGTLVGDVTTLEDEASVEEVKKAYEELRQQM